MGDCDRERDQLHKLSGTNGLIYIRSHTAAQRDEDPVSDYRSCMGICLAEAYRLLSSCRAVQPQTFQSFGVEAQTIFNLVRLEPRKSFVEFIRCERPHSAI